MAVPPDIRALAEAEMERSPLQLATIIDYLLVTTYDHGGRTPAGFNGPIELPGEVRIERLDEELAERLLRASDLRGENFDATRQYHVVHAHCSGGVVERPRRTRREHLPLGR